MKRVIIIVFAALLTLPAFTQELSKKEQKQLEKELRKEQKAEDAAQQAVVVDAMVQYHKFVLEANTLRDKRGNSIQVSSNINFIASDSITGVVQVGSNTYIGSNGVGGVTVQGMDQFVFPGFRVTYPRFHTARLEIAAVAAG